MSESTRLVDGSREPTKAEVADFIGKQNAARWAELTRFIAANYPALQARTPRVAPRASRLPGGREDLATHAEAPNYTRLEKP